MEKSWENMELAGMSDRRHGSLSVRMDTKDGSKKCNRTFQHFYRYLCRSLAQVGQQTEDGNLKTALQAGLSWHIHLCWGWSAQSRLRTTAMAKGWTGDIQSRRTALMCLEGQTLMVLHGVEPDYPSGPLNGSL